MSSPLHLVKRAVTSMSNKSPNNFDLARDILNADELSLWLSMPGRDQVHSLSVLSRFVTVRSTATKAEKAAALLHDVGKKSSNLGWVLRVVATLVGEHGKRFRDYHNHEHIGGEMLSGISDPRTIALVSGKANDEVAHALREADEI
jgi:hypothetical protein